MSQADAYRCKKCGAEYEPSDFAGRIHTDDDGFTEFRCKCGSTDYVELFECKFCHYLERPGNKKNKYLRWWGICDDCLGAVVNEYNSALDSIADDYRKILESIYDIRPINMKEEY